MMDTENKALVQYLYHSGFALELDQYFIIFDYYKSYPESIKESIKNRISRCRYPIVLASHSHYDHFNPEIFQWKEYNPNITYILSDDINDVQSSRAGGFNLIYMRPYEKKEVNNAVISTYGSTDLGVSFAIDINGLRIFHAGDLNWWHWADESTEEELAEEEDKFKTEVSKIDIKTFDIMFFPVDPRLGEYYWLGGAYMLENFHPGLFVPMHFADNTGVTGKFAERMTGLGVQIAVIDHAGQVFEYRKHK
mgnify:CR=1 FL=1